MEFSHAPSAASEGAIVFEHINRYFRASKTETEKRV
jgi:hypothetical protein